MNFKKYHVSRNLFDKNAKNTANGFIQDTMLQSDGTTLAWNVFSVSEYIPVEGGAEYYLSQVMNAAFNAPNLCFYDSSKQLISSVVYQARYSFAMIAPATAAYVRISYMNTQADAVMLNTGSTALPYEPYGNTWHDIPRYIHNTSTDTITTLPAVLYPNDTTATVGLKGNTVQNGTPTPDNPIMPQGTGDKTANLFDYKHDNYTNNAYLKNDGTEVTGQGWRISDYIACDSNTFTVSNVGGIAPSICLYDANKQLLTGKSYNTGGVSTEIPVTITSQSTAKYIRFSYLTVKASSIMLNVGGTALPYEPYGYKIPILSANTTTPVYLGEVQSTRQIKKLVLTGQETAYAYEYSGNNGYSIRDVLDTSYSRAEGYCSHYVVSTATPSAGTTQVLWIGASNAHLYFVGIADIIGTTSANEFKQWLAQQYSAGTPVTVWYVLATPTTGIVNEPLRKIGEYADTVSGITIPTITGADTLSVDTTLQPSEVTVNYHGWHPVQSVHECESGAWD